METKTIKMASIHPNKGELEGLPKNPRFIRDDKYKKLLQSIKDDPEMLELRELLVYDTQDSKLQYIIIGGNMRYRAMKELGYTEAPCKIIPHDFPMDKIRRILLKDNSSFGETDFELLINEWSVEEIDAAAIDIPDIETPQTEEQAEDDDFDIEANTPKEAVSKLGDIYQLGDHRLICGDSTKTKYLEALMAGERADLLVTDPPYNVNYEGGTGMKIQNDNMEDSVFLNFLYDAFNAANSVMREGGAFYVWHADSEGYNFRTAARQVGWKVRQCLIWNKNSLVLGRQDYQWKHEPCQPAGTMVLTPDGYRAIETLKDGDEVITYDKFSGQIKGYRKGGYKVKTASRDYDGLLYSVSVGDKTTRATDNHQFSVRFNPNSRARYCTYLMRKGDWWRVGQTKAYDARQFGLKTRLNQEQGEEVWLLGVYDNKIDAQVAEQILAVKYGIPYTCWNYDRFALEHGRSMEQIAEIYAAFDLDAMRERAYDLLHHFGRSERFPLVTKATQCQRFSTRVTARIHACNLVPDLMQLPVPTEDGNAVPNFQWESITANRFEPFVGRVYSLAVEEYEHYIADGIVTHNCLYGWKDGAAHYFVDKRNLTTTIEENIQNIDDLTKDDLKQLLQAIRRELPVSVIDCDKPKKNSDHPTMKPVPLIGQQVMNSSRKGETILDIFGGSGTTLIACEQLDRKCRMVEYDPIYVDVIIKRWEELTGGHAQLLANIEPKEQ